MKSVDIRKEFEEHVKNNLNYKISSIKPNKIKTDRKYAIGVNDNQLHIVDVRTKFSFDIKYSKVYENFESKKRKQQKKNYDLEKNYTEYVEISENGRYLMLIGKNDEESKKFRMYDVLENKLYKKPDMSVKLSSIDMIYYDKKLFIVGGLNQDGYVKNCEYFDLITDKWYPLPQLNLARELKSLLVINDTLITYFGNNEDSSVDVTTFEMLNLRELKNSNLVWEAFKIKNFSPEYSYNGMNAVLNDNLFFIFGGVTRDYEENVETGYVIDFSTKEVVSDIKLDSKKSYVSTNICSTYKNTICAINNETIEELSEFNLNDLNYKY